MATFAKANISAAFNPTFAFPVDARSYFTSLALAKAAAATAAEVGDTDTVYHYGMRLFVDDGISVKWYTIQRDGTLLEDGSGEGSTVAIDNNTLITGEDGALQVNTTDVIEAENALPVSSQAVYEKIGNIETLLNTI